MKFCVPHGATRYIKEEDVEWLTPADYNPVKNKITLFQWSNGWIIETDDNYDLYFALTTGKKLPAVTDGEYKQFLSDKAMFIPKGKARPFRLAWMDLR